jgi:SAM-dependent methyltransferase
MSFYDDDACARLYDVAFSWDIGNEVDWLLVRLGPNVQRVLEPACGSGRIFPAFAERGVEVVGVELAETMIDRARERMAARGLPTPQIYRGDMADFDLNDTFDGAVCPINSFGHLLTREQASTHLACVARHLRRGAKYMVQMDLVDIDDPPKLTPEGNAWETEHDGLKVLTHWFGQAFDSASRLETQVSRFEVLAGPEAGTVSEGEHVLRRWNWPEWTGLLDDSPFTLLACYDGNSAEFEPLPLDPSLENRWLIWHELALP